MTKETLVYDRQVREPFIWMDTQTCRCILPYAQMKQEAYVVIATSSLLPISFVNKTLMHRDGEHSTLLYHNRKMTHRLALTADVELGQDSDDGYIS